MHIGVTIPVKVGGYTGQREEWSAYENDYAVTVDSNGLVYLRCVRPHYEPNLITLNLDELLKAVAFVKDLNSSQT